MSLPRSHWFEHVRDIVRSRHYTWMAEGLGGAPIDVAMRQLLTDIHHVCDMADIPFDDVLAESREQYENEQAELHCPA